MGEIIQAKRSRDDILHDARVTLERSRVRGGQFAADAEARLAESLTVAASLAAESAGAAAELFALDAAVDRAEDLADTEIVRVVEQLFDRGGRRRNDPWLALLAPGGSSAWADGPTSDQPARMALFARLLRDLGHPHIPKEETLALAERITQTAQPLAAALDTARAPRARAAQLDRALTALARILRLELVALKQGWKSAGYSEAEIHTLIPDRPSTKPAPPDAPTPA